MRARNIKPGFFKNEELGAMGPLARLLFIGLWCMADRKGRLEDRPPRLKAEVLPYDDCDVDELLTMLDDAREDGDPDTHSLIERYQVDGRRYIQVVHFTKHQNPHRHEKASEIPALPGREMPSDEGEPRTVNALDNGGSSTDLAPEPPRDGLGLARLIPDSLDPDSLIPDALIPDLGHLGHAHGDGRARWGDVIHAQEHRDIATGQHPHLASLAVWANLVYGRPAFSAKAPQEQFAPLEHRCAETATDARLVDDRGLLETIALEASNDYHASRLADPKAGCLSQVLSRMVEDAHRKVHGRAQAVRQKKVERHAGRDGHGSVIGSNSAGCRPTEGRFAGLSRPADGGTPPGGTVTTDSPCV